MLSAGLINKVIDKIKVITASKSESIHWTELDLETLGFLTEYFKTNKIISISKVFGISEVQVQLWINESKMVTDLFTKVQTLRNDKKSKGHGRNYSDFIRLSILDLVPFTALSKLEVLTGVPRTTIFHWRENLNLPEEKVSVLKEDKPKLKSTVSTTVATNASVKTPITSSLLKEDLPAGDELEILKTMILRHKNKVRRKYSNSEKSLILKLVDQLGSKVVHESTKVSYDTLARLQRDRIRTYPKASTPVKYAPVIDVMKKYPGMGPMQIRDYVSRHLGLSMGVNSVRKVMEDRGWVASYARRVEVHEEARRYEAIRRNYLWHMDFKTFYINQCKAYLLFIEDDYSRFITGSAFAEGETIGIVLNTVSEAIALHGKPETIMTDGGSGFYSWRGISRFSLFLEELGVDQIVSKVPRINGKVESINQKFEKEVLNVRSFSSLKHLAEEHALWIGLYNFRRPHQGLPKLEVPADRYYPGSQMWFQENQKDPSSLLLEALSTLLAQLKNKN